MELENEARKSPYVEPEKVLKAQAVRVKNLTRMKEMLEAELNIKPKKPVGEEK